MSSAAIAPAPAPSQYDGEGAANQKRRSLFKPSTWKQSSGKAAAGHVEPGLEAPNGHHHHRGAQTLDGVETGAPLTALVSGEGYSSQQQHEQKEGGSDQAAAVSGGSGGIQDAQPLSQQQQQQQQQASAGSGLASVPDALGRIAFFRQDQPNYHLSNSTLAYPVVYNGIRYPSAEHLFQSLKFLPSHPEIASKVRRAKAPLDAMRIARSHTHLYNPGWIATGINVKVMHHVVLAKFSQYSALTEALLETEDREIVNASPTDVFWGEGGEGGSGRGRNVLGKTLMDVREVLRANSGVGYGSGAKTM